MMTRTIGTAAVFIALHLAWVPGASANDEGELLYEEFCQTCHGADKEGLQDYTGDLAAFTARLNGVTENMSDFTDFFDDDEIVALHEYLVQPE